MASLNEKTSLPLWAVLVSIPTFVTAMTWILSISFQTTANAKNIETLEASDIMQVNEFKTMRNENFKAMIEIQKDLAVIKAKLNERR